MKLCPTENWLKTWDIIYNPSITKELCSAFGQVCVDQSTSWLQFVVNLWWLDLILVKKKKKQQRMTINPEAQHNENIQYWMFVSWSSLLELWFVALTGSWCRSISCLASSAASRTLMRLFGSSVDDTSPSVFHSSSAKLPLPFYFLPFIYGSAHQRQIKHKADAVHHFKLFEKCSFTFSLLLVLCTGFSQVQVLVESKVELNVDAGCFTPL